MSDAKEELTITMPLYKWLMLLGVLDNIAAPGYYEALADQIMAAVQP